MKDGAEKNVRDTHYMSTGFKSPSPSTLTSEPLYALEQQTQHICPCMYNSALMHKCWVQPVWQHVGVQWLTESPNTCKMHLAECNFYVHK